MKLLGNTACNGETRDIVERTVHLIVTTTPATKAGAALPTLGAGTISLTNTDSVGLTLVTDGVCLLALLACLPCLSLLTFEPFFAFLHCVA